MGLFNVVGRATMAAGQPEDVTQILANLDAIAAVLNGNIEDVNVKATAGILASKLAGYPALGTVALLGDGTWGRKVTTSTWTAGPPGAPADGDIWNATNVDGLGTRWCFQYNAGSASPYKWEFIGGSEFKMSQVNANATINTLTNIPATVYYYYPGLMSVSMNRAGDWHAHGNVQFLPNGGASGDVALNAFIAGALAANGITIDLATTATSGVSLGWEADILAVNAATVFGVAGASPNNGVYRFGHINLFVRPIRIA